MGMGMGMGMGWVLYPLLHRMFSHYRNLYWCTLFFPYHRSIAGSSTCFRQMAALKGVQQSRARQPEGALLPRPWEPGAPQAADHRGAGQCHALLPDAGQSVLRSQLPKHEPLVNNTDASAQGSSRGRIRGHAHYRNGINSNKSAANCE